MAFRSSVKVKKKNMRYVSQDIIKRKETKQSIEENLGDR